MGGGVNIRKTILIGEKEEQVSTPCESVIKTNGYIGKKKNGISKSRLYIWVGQLDVCHVASHCIALPRRCGYTSSTTDTLHQSHSMMWIYINYSGWDECRGLYQIIEAASMVVATKS